MGHKNGWPRIFILKIFIISKKSQNLSCCIDVNIECVTTLINFVDKFVITHKVLNFITIIQYEDFTKTQRIYHENKDEFKYEKFKQVIKFEEIKFMV